MYSSAALLAAAHAFQRFPAVSCAFLSRGAGLSHPRTPKCCWPLRAPLQADPYSSS